MHWLVRWLYSPDQRPTITPLASLIGREDNRIGRPAGRPHVCLPSGAGNSRNLPNHPAISTYTTYVYPVTDLQRPAFTLHSGHYPRAVAFDIRGDLIYAQNFDNQLVIFSVAGRKLAEHALGERGNQTNAFLVHPEGRRVIVQTEERLYYVEVPQL